MAKNMLYRGMYCSKPECEEKVSFKDEDCWIESDDESIGFCSVLCKKEFMENYQHYKKQINFRQQIYNKRSRQRKEEDKVRMQIAQAICKLYFPNPTKEEVQKIKLIVDLLELQSKILQKNVSL